jgi:hypothetical protein
LVRALALTSLVVSALGCQRGPKTPEEAFARVEHAVAAGDAAELYRALDRRTRDLVDAAYRDEQMQRTIIAAKYPEAEARAALAKLDAAAEPDAERFFAKRAHEDRVLEAYRKRLGSVSGPIVTRKDADDTIWMARQDGAPFKLVKRGRDGWGFAELEPQWSLERDRASHGVQTARDNARLYSETK